MIPTAPGALLDAATRSSEKAHSDDLLQHLSTAVLVLDGGLHIVRLNQAAEQLLQTSALRCLGERIDTVLTPVALTPLDKASAERSSHSTNAAFQEALRSGQSFTARSIRLRLPQGAELQVDYTVTAYAPRSVARVSTIPSGLIVEVSPADSTAQIRRDEAQASIQESARQLLRGLAHEVKNPLGGVRGAAQLLERELPTEQLREYTRIIIDEADRLRDLVDRLLTTQHKPFYSDVNIHRVLERVLQLIEVETPQLCVERDYDPSIPALRADEAQLIQATLNVLRNAQQALAERGTGKGDRPKIIVRSRIVRQPTLGLRRHRLAVRLELIDNGPGIPTEIMDKIFLPMISGRAAGSGLGLSIAQGIVSQHQGTIECTSEPGRTRFAITLPVEHAPSENAP